MRSKRPYDDSGFAEHSGHAIISETLSIRAGFGELLDALMDVQYRLRERQAASLFEDRN